MYAPTFAIAQAFADCEANYRDVAAVKHRTPSPSQKHAEALGRREDRS
jgi:hypothetical protein